MKILDCTIRDGGHLNKWRFDPSTVRFSYFAAVKSGVDYFEIGYRFPKSIEGLGDFGYCSDEFLFSLFKPKEKCKLVVMADAGKSNSSLFKECKPDITPITGVRVAAYPHEIDRAIDFVEDLKSKGYEVFLNLMTASELKKAQYDRLNSWENKNILNAVVFADSFGSFIPSNISEFINKLKKIGFSDIGFHPHNNLQLAFANTLKAIEEGATYVDASVFGMGRGAGNLPIESLIGYFEKEGIGKFNVIPYLDLIERYFYKLMEELQWGYKVQTLLCGLMDIHPYYVDDLFKKRTYTIEEIWNSLKTIKENCPVSYSESRLDKALGDRFYVPLTPESAEQVNEEIIEQFKIFPAVDAFKTKKNELENLHAGRKFLVIANGPSIMKYKNAIDQFIEKNNCVTIGVNYLKNLFVPDYHIFISRKRYFKYFSEINESSTLLIPSFFGRELIDNTYKGDYYYFDLETTESSSAPPIVGGAQICVNLNVGISAILMAYQMGAEEIYVVGMDGYFGESNKEVLYFYNEDDIPDSKIIASLRYEKLSKELIRTNRFLQENGVFFSIITPTSHKKYFTQTFDEL